MLGHGFDLLCVSHLRWGFVYQRPQHLMSRCARQRRVFYVEEPVFDEGPAWLEVRQEAGKLWVAVPHLATGTPADEAIAEQARLLDELIDERGLERYVLWMYTPMAVPFTSHLDPAAIVYDCMDELSAFSLAPADLAANEQRLFEMADLVFTGGRSLYEAKRDRHNSVFMFPSGVDATHFRAAREEQPDPADQADIPHPRLGFYGVVDERMDLELLRELADARPELHLVIVGPVVKIDEADLPQRDNIHYLGGKTYDELPRYAAGWDAAMMPFALNESTRFISPTKTPEYLASGLPVVSTPISDVVHSYSDLSMVRIASDAAGFSRAASELMEADHSAGLAKVDERLDRDSWDRTWDRMGHLIEGVLSVQRSNGHDRALTSVEEHAPPRGFDYMIVGAGFAGSVVAERLASQGGRSVLIVEKRNHIGGNAFDHFNADGILVHRYGPHIFHTNADDVFHHLSAFTSWRQYQHRVLASVDGRLVPIPINLDTINELYGLSLTSAEVEDFFASVAEPVEQVRTSEDVVVSRVGRELYEKFFRDYTRKQWGMDPSELDASVTSRVPVRTNRDPRYFTDKHQAMPEHGYTRMFERMLDDRRIKVMLNTDFREVRGLIPHGEVVYTGPVDEFFDHRYGRLPYRSLEFVFETRDVARHQPAAVINYPRDFDYTRVTEFKYLTGQEHSKTSLVYEYPRAEGDPYYPVPKPENAALYRRYKALADATPGVHFVGRLATYKYYNMDQVVAQALSVAKRLVARGTTASNGSLSVLSESPVRPTA
ncbi:MAG TPA: UDP-galactopyranose mutase [Actinomycetota bacterium]|nr:UDP-galactopyranose mutase [Actinomycetota bacterium]